MRLSRRASGALALILFIGALTGCGGASTTSAGGTGGSAAPTPADITIAGFAFGPVELTVKPGQTLTVVNKDQAAHTVTSETAGAFDSGTLRGGASGTVTAPMTAGRYPYICTIHPDMKGVLVVG